MTVTMLPMPPHDPPLPPFPTIYDPLQKVQIFVYQHANLAHDEGVYWYLNESPSFLRSPAYLVACLLPSGEVRVDFVHCGRVGELGVFYRTLDAGRGFCHFETGSITELRFNFCGYEHAQDTRRPLRRLILDPVYDPIEPFLGITMNPMNFPNGEHILGYRATFQTGRERVVWAFLVRKYLRYPRAFFHWAETSCGVFIPGMINGFDYSEL